MSIIIQAARFANDAHRGQYRKNTVCGLKIPYIIHVGRVVARVSTLINVTEDMIAAAWLHDVIEDCGIPIALIEKQFNTKVAEHVTGLTSYSKRTENRIVWEARPRKERVAANNAAYEHVDDDTKRIKCCDRIDNLTDTLIQAKPDFALRYVEETKDLMKYLYADVEVFLSDQIDELLKAITKKYTQSEVRNDLQTDIYG